MSHQSASLRAIKTSAVAVKEIRKSKLLSKNSWEKFLEVEHEKLRATYAAKKERLISDANAERESCKDYNGREILELLQNADDAATENSVEGQVRFELTEDGLIIGNTGRPFSKGGLGSILLAHNSPKRKKNGTLIGAKGLGFRSLLNWSANPILISGNLEVGFSREYAEKEVGTLCQLIPGLSGDLKASRVQVPILCFPYWNDIEHWSDPILHTARRMAADFDTVIALPLKNDDLRNKISAQLDELSPRLMLFLQSINRIEICGTSRSERNLELEADGGVFTLTSSTAGQNTSEQWMTKSLVGDLPAELLDDAEIRQRYQVTTAIRLDDLVDYEALSSYFPTQHEMPVPGLFHATLDLEQNRQRIRKSAVNVYVLKRMAALHAQFLEELASEGVLDPISFLHTQESPDDPLKKFVLKLFAKARDRAIVSVRSGKFVLPRNAKAFPEPHHDFKDSRRFRNFAMQHDQDDRDVLERLGVELASEKEIVSEIVAWKMSISQRASLLSELLEQGYRCDELRLLLIGERGAPGKNNTKWFPPQTKGKKIVSFPDGLGFRFINRGLWDCLCQEFGDTETVFDKMADFGVERYDPYQIIEAFSLRLNDLAGMQRANLEKRMLEFVLLLATLFKGPRAGMRSLADVDIWWLTQEGEWALANTLHVAGPASRNGLINRTLFRRRPDLLASSAHNLVPGLKKEELEGFLVWIGVNRWPRKVTRPLEKDDWTSLLRAYPETVSYIDHHGRKKQERLSAHSLGGYSSPRFEGETKWIDALDDILECGSDDAILAWLGSEAGGALEKLGTNLLFKPSGNAIARRVSETPETSLVLTRVAETCWMRDDLCADRAPRELLRRSRTRRSLQSPYLLLDIIGPRPIPLDEKSARAAFDRAGLSSDLENASMPALFRCLLRLADCKASAREVMPIYRSIAEKQDWSLEEGGTAAEEFKERGLMLARGPDGFDWVKPKDALFVSAIDPIRMAIGSTRLVIDIEKASDQFLAATEIQSLNSKDIQFVGVRAERPRPDLCNAITARFEESKGWIDLWAGHSDASISRRKVVHSAGVLVAESVVLELRLQGEKYEAALPAASCIHHADSFLLSVDADCEATYFQDFSFSKLADSVGDFLGLTGRAAFKEMFRAGSKEARRLHLTEAFPELDERSIDELLSEGSDALEKSRSSPAATELPPLEETAENSSRAACGEQKHDAGVARVGNLVERLKGTNRDSDKLTGSWIEAAPEPVASKSKRNSDLKRGGRPRTSRRVSVSSTGVPEEEAAFGFEQDQNRFPLRLDTERGLASEGCDLVSFNSKDDRDAYCKTRNSSLVARFIEVKGSELRLSKSQTRSARKHSKKYYIYSADLGADGAVTIEHFCDPIEWSGSEDWVLIVDRELAPPSLREKFAFVLQSEEDQFQDGST